MKPDINKIDIRCFFKINSNLNNTMDKFNKNYYSFIINSHGIIYVVGDEGIMLDKVIKSCKYVVENSDYVRINYDKLDDFIDKIDCNNIGNWLIRNPYNLFELEIDKIINLLLIYECICYSFWGNPKWTIKSSEGYKDGSDALLYILIDYVKDNNTDFSNMTFRKFSDLLKGNVDIPLIKERYKTIKEVSKIINKKMNGNFYDTIKNYTTDIELFEFIVSNFSCFDDVREYNGMKIYFYKLAQLLTSDILHIREYLENIDVDYSHLIGCADYKIPQTLRALEILEYNDELSGIIDNKKEIEISSKYEVEIRASQIVVIDYIKSKLKNVNSIDVNDYIFLYSKKVKNIVKPYHLCRNTNY